MGQILYLFLFLCFLTTNSVLGTLTVEKSVTLKTRFATLLGTLETVTSNGVETSYFAFRGLPFAEEAKRWQDPILKLPLGENSLFNATVEKSPCPQWTKTGLLGDENCLYASVFIPIQSPSNSNRTPLKIMVFFHGGGFLVNANRNMLPIPLLAQKNVIVVMFNYRVSIFGYLSTGTSLLPGNYAFLDQITMLKWIKMYGKDFGGDVNDITIFGSSIGSVSIHYLLLSKLGTGLFHKAIMSSGSAFCERSLVPNPLEISMKLGSHLQCPDIENQQSLVECLKSMSMFQLMAAAKLLTVDGSLPSILGPVIDNISRPPKYQFLPDFPENLPVINKVPVVVGITKDEGLTAFVKLSKNYNREQLHNLGFIQSTILPHYLSLIMRSRSASDRQTFIDNLTKQVMNVYWKSFAKDPISALVGILGDLWINTCNRKTLEHLCMNAVPSVHSYLFTHHDAGISPSQTDQEILSSFRKNGINHPIFDQGVAHTEENLYLLEKENDIFSLEGSLITRFPRNKIMSDILSNIWTHFASSRNAASQVPVVSGWPKWNPICYNHTLHDSKYPLYEISLDNHRMFPHFRLQETEFWWKKHQETFKVNAAAGF